MPVVVPAIRVLFVEDNPNEADMVHRMLAAERGRAILEVEHADRLSAALDRLAKGNLDVILLDLNLPDGRGLDLFLKIRAAAPAIPIVVLTATFEEEELAADLLRKGAQDYLDKGEVDGRILSHAIRYAVERNRVEQALLAKLKEMEFMNRIMMDREEKIIELKEEIRRLKEPR